MPILPATEQPLAGYRAKQGAEHVGLRVPRVALGAEKLIGALAQRQRRPPLDKLIHRADRQRDTAHYEAQHFAALRAARDTRLADTDKMLLPDYPITAEALAQIKVYRASLRDLPDQPGAPWDGGGEATPWPAATTPATGSTQAEQSCA